MNFPCMVYVDMVIQYTMLAQRVYRMRKETLKEKAESVHEVDAHVIVVDDGCK